MAPKLAEVFQLMAAGPDQDQRPSFTALLVVSAEEAGARKADRRERQREISQNPETIEQPPMRRRLPGEWQHRVFVQDGEVRTSLGKCPTTPAGWTGESGYGPLELMLQPWRFLGGYQFDAQVEEAVVAERECWLVRGKTRIVEPLFDHFVARWARASDSGLLAIDKELGIALSIVARFSERAWYRAELHGLSSQDLGNAEESTESDDDELDIVEAGEAVKRLQFTLYLPERVPRNSEMEIQVDKSGTWAGVSFERSDSQWRVLVQERPAEATVEEDLDEVGAVGGEGVGQLDLGSVQRPGTARSALAGGADRTNALQPLLVTAPQHARRGCTFPQAADLTTRWSRSGATSRACRLNCRNVPAMLGLVISHGLVDTR
jgi:hypothetical protein